MTVVACQSQALSDLPDLRVETAPFCQRVNAFADLFDEVSSVADGGLTTTEVLGSQFPQVVPDLAEGFEQDRLLFVSLGDTNMAEVAEAAATGARLLAADIARLQTGRQAPGFGDHLESTVKALTGARPNFCSPPDEREWVAAEDTVEVSAPADWGSSTQPWVLPDGQAVGTGVLASDNPFLWLDGFPSAHVPGVFVGRSDQLAAELGLSERRFASALDQVRSFAETRLDRADICTGGALREFSRPSAQQHGFLRLWHDCGGAGVLLVEALQLRPLPGGDRSLIYLSATAYAPGDGQPLYDALRSFHLVTEAS